MHPRTEELLAYLDKERAALRAAFESIPASLTEKAPAPGSWSATQCIEHLAIVGELIAMRINKHVGDAKANGLARESDVDPILPGTKLEMVLDRGAKLSAPDPIQPKGVSAAAAWEAIDRAGASMRDAVKAADGYALGAVSWAHPRFGPLTGYQWIAFSGAHEARHAAQIREIAEQLRAS
jgi:hypothetical protein